MPTCEECKNFFPLDDDPTIGDCVTRVVDPRQAYHTAKPTEIDTDASGCATFQKK